MNILRKYNSFIGAIIMLIPSIYVSADVSLGCEIEGRIVEYSSQTDVNLMINSVNQGKCGLKEGQLIKGASVNISNVLKKDDVVRGDVVKDDKGYSLDNVIVMDSQKVVTGDGLAELVRGRILLQVEQQGEAWYINPKNDRRYFMGRPRDAFNLMRELGVGVSNANLEKIKVASVNLGGEKDSDIDGLSDAFEDAIGSDKNNNDTDGDSYKDKQEFESGYNVNGVGQKKYDVSFAKKQAGRILLKVEGLGEAWYVNPADNKRYFLGKPIDALNIMRKVGLGVRDDDLIKILENTNLTDNN